MKKLALFLVLCTLGGATLAFGQVSLDMHLSMFPYPNAISKTGTGYSYARSGVVPSVGIGVNVGPVDILGGIEFSMERFTDNDGEDWESATTEIAFGIYAGVAPRAEVTQNLTLSFPILGKFSHYSAKIKYEKSAYEAGIEKLTYNTFEIDLGARAYYAFNQKWSVYTGVEVIAMRIVGEGEATPFTGSSSKDKAKYLSFLYGGSIDLGVKLTF